MKKLFGFLVLAALVGAAGAGVYYWQTHQAPPNHFRTMKAQRGPLVATIGATGTIQPEDVVDVGAQVAGRIERFGLDPKLARHRSWLRLTAALSGGHGYLPLALVQALPNKCVDYNTFVEPDTILAEVDPSTYQTQVAAAEANLIRARSAQDRALANQYKAEADLEQFRANRDQAKSELQRNKAAGKGVSPFDLEVSVAKAATAEANVKVARRAIEVAEADVHVADADVLAAQAALHKARIDLGYTVIRSPVKGVIVERRVNVGQTVVASLNAPSLFLIAKDLRRLQIWAQVNEADIGQVHGGMPVKFRVDTHGERDFDGVVARDQPRLNAIMTQNVVTYTVVVDTENPVDPSREGVGALVLKPYMTANLQFIAQQRSNALMVPNAALRWRPQVSQVVPGHEREEFQKALAAAQEKKRLLTAPSAEKKQNPAAADPKNALKEARERASRGTVWVTTEDGFVRPVKLRLGITDGSHTEVLAGELGEGEELIVGEARQADGGGSNPFGPPAMFGSKKKE